MVEVLILDTHFFHGVGSQYGFHFGDNRPLKAQNYDLVIFLHSAINKHAVDSGTISLNHLHLHDCTPKHVLLHLDLLADVWQCGGVLDNHREEIGNTLSSDA